MKKIFVIDGQGGKIGQEVIKSLINSNMDIGIIAVGTNTADI